MQEENTEIELTLIDSDYEVKPVMFKRKFFIFKDDKVIIEFEFEHDERINKDRKTIDEIKLHSDAIQDLIHRVEDEIKKYEGTDDIEWDNYEILN